MNSFQRYEALSINGRLAAALLTFEEWLRVHRINDAGVSTLLEHLWRWPTIGPDTFDAWHRFETPELGAAESEGPLPDRLTRVCQQHGASPDALRDLLCHSVNIVYYSLFGALNLNDSLERLRRIEAIAEQAGVQVPPAERFREQSAEDMHGWGKRVSLEEVQRWRAQR